MKKISVEWYVDDSFKMGNCYECPFFTFDKDDFNYCTNSWKIDECGLVIEKINESYDANKALLYLLLKANELFSNEVDCDICPLNSSCDVFEGEVLCNKLKSMLESR